MKRRGLFAGIAAIAASLLGGIAYAAFSPPATPPLQGAAAKRAYDFNLTRIDGEPLPLAAYRGKVVLLVNTASMCGFTPQYEGLQALQTKYGPKGFTVIGVPSGDFKEQEYGSNKEISTFCQTTFGIKFPLAEKGHVVGPEALPVYRWAAAVLGADQTPKWNFHKYLIGPDGKLIRAFETKITPTDARVTGAIEQALKGARA